MGKARLNNSILWEAMSIAGHNVSLFIGDGVNTYTL